SRTTASPPIYTLSLHDALPISQGRPISPDDEVLVLDDEDNSVPAGEVGHLLTRGPYTIRGYYRADEHNAHAFTPEGFYRTGDLVDRKSTRLNSSHVSISYAVFC